MLLARRLQVVLEPVSHPELGAIHVRQDLFAVGRNEPPFAQVPAEIAGELSRRHAKIFIEHGAAYVADLGSKNGTTVNGIDVRAKPRLLLEGDEIRFAGVFACRVEFEQCPENPPLNEAQALVLTLTPERADLGLEPIVVADFPFLVSKTDDAFARYREAYPHQVNYVSRRHALLFVERGDIFVEDLGSTNGTFVDGTRLEECAVALADGARLAFGGNHFDYRVGIRRAGGADRTVTHIRPPLPSDAQPNVQLQAQPQPQSESQPPFQPQAQPQPEPQPSSDGAPDRPAAVTAASADMDRTTFVAAPHSFLDIFCVDPTHAQEDEVNYETVAQKAALSHAAPPRRGKVATFIDELSIALGGKGTPDAIAGFDRRRTGRYLFAALALGCVLAVALYVRPNPQREMKALMAQGRVDAAAQLADGYLARHPNDAAFEATGADALMKAKVPGWLAALDAHAYGRARALAGELDTLARHNREAAPLAAEIRWLSDLEAFWAARGGPDAPIVMYRDEAVIESLIARWNDDPNEHQRLLDQITSYVPAFGERYADALSHLRQLQTDDSVYVAALDRVKTAIDAALDRAQPEALNSLPALLDDYASRYPRLAAGLATVRGDLSRYGEIMDDVRGGDAQAATHALSLAHFATPPFRAREPELKKRVATLKGSQQ
jgi:pSer/pThr/pTyr-binding forkhead associated (FHA) protein